MSMFSSFKSTASTTATPQAPDKTCFSSDASVFFKTQPMPVLHTSNLLSRLLLTQPNSWNRCHHLCKLVFNHSQFTQETLLFPLQLLPCDSTMQHFTNTCNWTKSFSLILCYVFIYNFIEAQRHGHLFAQFVDHPKIDANW